MINQLHKIGNKCRFFLSDSTAAAVTLILGFSLSAHASTWNGGSTTSSNWSDAANWGGTAITSGSAATFAGTKLTTNFNDITGLSLGAITLTNGVWNISGNPVTLTTSTFNANVAGNCNWNLDSVLSVTPSITQNATGDNLYLRGVLSGSGGLTKTAGGNGQGVLYLMNTNNSFTGPVNISGTLAYFSLALGGQNSALGAGIGAINIGALNTGYPATITYVGTNNGTTDRPLHLQSLNTGTTTLNNNSPNNSSLIFNGLFTFTDGSLLPTNFPTIFGGTSTGTNTFNQPIGVYNSANNGAPNGQWGGTLQVNGPGTWVFNQPINTTSNLTITANAHIALGFYSDIATSDPLCSTITMSSGTTLDVSSFDASGQIFTLGANVNYPQTLVAGHTNNTSAPDINGSLSLNGGAASVTLNVSTIGIAATLAINGNFTPGAAIINMDMNTNAAGVSDLITVAGNLDLSQGAATVNLRAFHGPVQVNVPYTLIAYNGTLTGSAAGLNVIAPNGLYTASVSTATPNLITVTFVPSGGSIVNLVWQGNVSGDWDTTTANWLNGGSSANFSAGNNAVFNNSASQTAVNLVGQLVVNNLTVSNNVNNYTFASSSGGGLTDAFLLKQGSGSLLISSANSFSEGTIISAGTVQAGSATAFGTGGVTLGDANTGTNVTTLGFSGGVSAVNPVTTAAGSTGTAVIANMSSSTSVTYNGPIVLQRGITFSNANSALNTFMIQGGITGTGDVTVLGGGGVKLQTGACSFTGNIYVLPGTSGTTLCNVNATLAANTSINLAAGTQLGDVNSPTFNALIGAGNVIAGPGAAYIPSLSLGNGNGSGTFSGIITTNSGGWTPSVIKNGTGTEIFTGDFTGASSGFYTNTGATSINAGTLAINNPTGTGLNPFGVSVAAAGTLAGNGSIYEGTNGVSINGKLSVGNAGDTTGKSFTVTNTTAALRFNASSTLLVDLFSGVGAGDNTGNAAAADVLQAQTQVIITNATLTVSNLNNLTAWTIGDRWKIANWSSTVTGVFTNYNLPALPSTLAWDTSALYTSGVIGIMASSNPTAPANITSVTISGGNVILTGTNLNGGTSFHYLVLTTTNLATALTNWTVLSTNSFNANGSFSYTNVIDPAQPAAFFSTKVVQ